MGGARRGRRRAVLALYQGHCPKRGVAAPRCSARATATAATWPILEEARSGRVFSLQGAGTMLPEDAPQGSQSCRIFSPARDRGCTRHAAAHAQMLTAFRPEGYVRRKRNHSSDAEPRRRRRVRVPRAGRSRTHMYIFAR